MMLFRRIDPPLPFGRLTGRVYCATTQAPLAAAKIGLQPVGPAWGHYTGISVPGESDAEGRFDFPSIQIGTYYAFATLRSYISPVSQIPRWGVVGGPFALQAPSHVLDSLLPRVTIDEERAAAIDFTLEVGVPAHWELSWSDRRPVQEDAFRDQANAASDGLCQIIQALQKRSK